MAVSTIDKTPQPPTATATTTTTTTTTTATTTTTCWSVVEPKPDWQDSLIQCPPGTPSSLPSSPSKSDDHNSTQDINDVRVPTPQKSSPPSTPEPCPRRPRQPRPPSSRTTTNDGDNHQIDPTTFSALKNENKKTGKECEVIASEPLVLSKRLSSGSVSSSSSSSSSSSCHQDTVAHPSHRSTSPLSSTAFNVTLDSRQRRSSSTANPCCINGVTRPPPASCRGCRSKSQQTRPPFVVSKVVSERPRPCSITSAVDYPSGSRVYSARRHSKPSIKEEEEDPKGSVTNHGSTAGQGNGSSRCTTKPATVGSQTKTTKSQSRESTSVATSVKSRKVTMASKEVTPSSADKRKTTTRVATARTTTTTTTTTTPTTKTTQTKQSASQAVKPEAKPRVVIGKNNRLGGRDSATAVVVSKQQEKKKKQQGEAKQDEDEATRRRNSRMSLSKFIASVRQQQRQLSESLSLTGEHGDTANVQPSYPVEEHGSALTKKNVSTDAAYEAFDAKHHVQPPHVCSNVEDRTTTTEKFMSKSTSNMWTIPWTPCTISPEPTATADDKESNTKGKKETLFKTNTTFVVAPGEEHAISNRRALSPSPSSPQPPPLREQQLFESSKRQSSSILLESIPQPSSISDVTATQSSAPKAAKRSSLAGRALCIAAKDWILAKNVMNGSEELLSSSKERRGSDTTSTFISSTTANRHVQKRYSLFTHASDIKSLRRASASSYREEDKLSINTPPLCTTPYPSKTSSTTSATPKREKRLSIPLKVKQQYLEEHFQVQKRNSTVLLRSLPQVQDYQHPPQQLTVVKGAPRTRPCGCQHGLDSKSHHNRSSSISIPPQYTSISAKPRKAAMASTATTATKPTISVSAPLRPHENGDVTLPSTDRHLRTRAHSEIIDSTTVIPRITTTAPDSHSNNSKIHNGHEGYTLLKRFVPEPLPQIQESVMVPSPPHSPLAPPIPEVSITSWLQPQSPLLQPTTLSTSNQSNGNHSGISSGRNDFASMSVQRASQRMDMTLLTKRLINLRRLESVCSTERLMGLFHTESASPSPSPSPPSKRSSASETTEQQDCNQPYERTSNDTSDNSQKTLHPTPPSSLSSSPSSTTLLPPVILRPKDGKTRDCQLWSLELQNTLANLSFTDCVQPYMDVAHVHRLSCGRVPEDQMQVGDDDDDYGEEEEDGDEDERDGKFSFSLSANLKSNKPPPWVSPSIPKRRTHVDEEHEHILTLDWLNRLQRLPPSLLELYPGLKREVQKLAHQV